MQGAAGLGREGGDFAIGVEAGCDRITAEHFQHRLHFLLDALLEHQFAADATDEDSQVGLPLGDFLTAGFGSTSRAIDQPIEIRPHQPRQRALRHISGEGHALVPFIDRQDGADDALAGGFLTQCQRKEQATGRQSAGVRPQIILVQLQC